MNDFTLGEIRKCKEDEVKPCPFCGGKEIVIDKYKYNSGERYRIFCTGCMAMIDPGYAQQEYTVIKMWNKRVQMEQSLKNGENIMRLTPKQNVSNFETRVSLRMTEEIIL